MATPTAAAAATEGVWVSGSGTCCGAIGAAEIVLVALTTCAAAAQAVRENTARIQQMGLALSTAGVAAQDMQTIAMTLVPLYAQAPVDTPAVAGYRLASSIRVVVREPNHLGELLDKAIASGAHMVQSIQLRLRDEAAARKIAVESAIADAQAKAANIAAALGRQLGPAVTVLEDVLPAAPNTGATDVSSTSGLSIQARVQVMFRLK